MPWTFVSTPLPKVRAFVCIETWIGDHWMLDHWMLDHCHYQCAPMPAALAASAERTP